MLGFTGQFFYRILGIGMTAIVLSVIVNPHLRFRIRYLAI